MSTPLVIDLHPVLSTHVAAIGYHDARRVLRVRFTSGAVYDYLGVPPDVYDALQLVSSKGRYLQHSVIGSYLAVRVRGPDTDPAPAAATEEEPGT